MAQITTVSSEGQMVKITLADTESAPPYETIILLEVQETEGLSDTELDRLVNQKIDQKNKELSMSGDARVAAEVTRVNSILE
tara:strand:+ start:608 stop:853 length:246 start_codon:yes stop_codon:yes gene_type:complete